MTNSCLQGYYALNPASQPALDLFGPRNALSAVRSG
jgi:hypothetical protein